MSAVNTDLELIQALDFKADETVPCRACEHPATWRITTACCQDFQSFVCPEHRRLVEFLLDMTDQSKGKCGNCSSPWIGVHFHPLGKGTL